MSHYIITGRLEYDDEDTVIVTEATSKFRAVLAFKNEMCTRECFLKGDPIYINSVHVSSTPITEAV